MRFVQVLEDKIYAVFNSPDTLVLPRGSIGFVSETIDPKVGNYSVVFRLDPKTHPPNRTVIRMDVRKVTEDSRFFKFI